MEANKVLFAIREKIDSLLGETHEEDKEALLLPRQALHAARLTLNHVGLREEMTFEAPLTQDVRDFMATLPPRAQ